MGVQASSQKEEKEDLSRINYEQKVGQKEDLSRRRYEQKVARDGELRCMGGGAFVPLVCSGELPCVRSGHDCVVIRHRAYLFGGYDGKGNTKRIKSNRDLLFTSLSLFPLRLSG
jgi:hypothetical protein